jgi:hypothetical protein
MYRQIARRHTLAICCIAAPLLLAAAVPDRILSWLVPITTSSLNLPAFVFLPDEPPQSAAARVSKEKRGEDEIDRIESRDRTTLLAARDISGRYRYAATSALLLLVSIAAFAFGAVVVARRLGPASLTAAVVWSLAVSLLLALYPPVFERVRPLIVEFILQAEDTKNFLKPLTFDGWETPKIVTGLIRINTGVGVMAVGMLLTALYAASMRASDEELTFDNLTERRWIARWVLGLGAAILVVAVLQSAVVVDWPPSLLVKSQQLAVKPIGNAMTLLLGAMGTIALFAALAPALVAFILDVGQYRATPAGQAAASSRTDELGFAPLSSVAGVLTVLAPLLVSALAEVVKALL